MIEPDWAKYRDCSVTSRLIICRIRRLRQIIDLRDTDKSRYIAITEFNNYFIIRSLFSWSTKDVKSLSLNGSTSCVSNTHDQNICRKTLICITYFQPTWWALGQWKGRKSASNDNINKVLRNWTIISPIVKKKLQCAIHRVYTLFQNGSQ